MVLIEILGVEDASEIESLRAKDGTQEIRTVQDVNKRQIDLAEEFMGLEVFKDVKTNILTSRIKAKTNI